VTRAGTSWFFARDSMGLFRLGALAVVLAVNAYLLFDPTGIVINVEKRNGNIEKYTMFGMVRFTTFTTWCWTLQAFYFASAAACSFADRLFVNGDHSVLLSIGTFSVTPTVIARVAWVLFEVSFAVAFLVSFIVTYVLIPGAMKRGASIDNFFNFAALAMHNANAIFMAIELALNRFPFQSSHCVFACMLGLAYVLFAQFWCACLFVHSICFVCGDLVRMPV
jgi:hypothetical protein